MIALTINGEPHRLEGAGNVLRLLEHLELGAKRVAVERNGEIIPRSKFELDLLRDGDRVEIVVAVGGG